MGSTKTSLTPEDIQKMIDSVDFPRDKVILTFLSDVGCRVSELLALTVEDVDLNKNEALIPHLKRGGRGKKKCPECGQLSGRKKLFCSQCSTDISKIESETTTEIRTRLITFGSETSVLLESYIRNEELKPSDLLIGISRQQVYTVIREAALAAGIKGKALLNPETSRKHYVSPHRLRDALAIDWLNFAHEDANKQKALQMHLGHKDFATTMRYAKLSSDIVKGIGDEVRKARFEKHE